MEAAVFCPSLIYVPTSARSEALSSSRSEETVERTAVREGQVHAQQLSIVPVHAARKRIYACMWGSLAAEVVTRCAAIRDGAFPLRNSSKLLGLCAIAPTTFA